jgi:membrane associated rhomboid family serine protease
MDAISSNKSNSMSSFSDNIRTHIRLSDTLQRLILINVVFFFLVRIVNALSELFMHPVFSFEDVSYYTAIPANLDSLVRRPWTILTYMFFHWDILHILFNMLWLYWMGRIFQEYLGNKKLINTYILGGITGALFFVIGFNLFPLFSGSLPASFALGASASVLAITVAAATLLPNYPIQLFLFGNVKLKWIAAVTILLDLINVSGSNAGGHIAHIGGAFYGFLYITMLKKGTDLSGWLTVLLDRFSGRPRMRVSKVKTKHDEEFIANKKAKQEKMDDILDKISKSGYGSLTQAEKDFLFQMSKEN